MMPCIRWNQDETIAQSITSVASASSAQLCSALLCTALHSPAALVNPLSVPSSLVLYGREEDVPPSDP